MSSDSRAGKEDSSKHVDAKTLLATNGGMVTGILFFLTLSSFLTGESSSAERIFAGILTISIVCMFARSAYEVLPTHKEPDLKTAKLWIRGGLVYVPFYLALIVLMPLFLTLSSERPLQIFEEIRIQCGLDPESFNVTVTPWKCEQFSSGSLAEGCAKNPEVFNMSKSECHQLIPP